MKVNAVQQMLLIQKNQRQFEFSGYDPDKHILDYSTFAVLLGQMKQKQSAWFIWQKHKSTDPDKNEFYDRTS